MWRLTFSSESPTIVDEPLGFGRREEVLVIDTKLEFAIDPLSSSSFALNLRILVRTIYVLIPNS